MPVYLGIDTSCYTTSLALVDGEGNLLLDKRIPLPVPAGEQGLRQSEGVFHHVRHLSSIWGELELPALSAVGVSSRPRPVDDSYMPVFLPGLAVAGAVAAAQKVPLYRFSHQEGHIAAGLGNRQPKEAFMAAHLSGGTSEVLQVAPREGAGFHIDLLKGSDDLNAGQLVDRVGVVLGLPFPAGPSLEALAQEASGNLRLTGAKGFGFSGPLSAALRLVQSGEAAEEIAFAVFRVIANALEKELRAQAEKSGLNKVLLAGGVMSNSFIRRRLVERLGRRLNLIFAEPRLCTDNGVGAAFLARAAHRAAGPR